MKLEMRGQMRMEQRMKLAPHMIQSMEILQLPILALQERIEQELNSNPVLEMAEPESPEDTDSVQEESQEDTDEKDLVLRILAMVSGTIWIRRVLCVGAYKLTSRTENLRQ